MKIEDLQNKKIAILGFGLEGQSTLGFLQKQGIENITILDKNQNLEPSSLVKGEDSGESWWKERNLSEGVSLAGKGEFLSWVNYLDSLWDFDLIFKSPGVSPFGEKLLPHREKFISQAQVFFANYSGKVIGITGTKGKSTISTLLFTLLEEAWYRVKLVGNIGSPVLDEIDILSEKRYDYVVYEMSSYMLQDFTPELYIGFLNNIYPCHLDWHYDSMNIYKEAKLNILKNAQYKVINSELNSDTQVLWIPWEKLFFNEAGKYQYKDSHIYKEWEKFLDCSKFALKWEHNYKNISGVVTTLALVIDDENTLNKTLEGVLSNFSGLPHRIQDIWVYEGIRFINDAIATTPESTIAACKTFQTDLQTLFLGGEDSGFDFIKLRTHILDSSVMNIVAFPDTSEKIFPEIEQRDYEIPFEIEISGKMLQFIKTRSMKQAVDFAYKTTLPWKIALLSCAAPSFSLWKNYKQKAEEFIKEVQEY